MGRARSGVALFLDLGGLADAIAQVVQLRPAHIGQTVTLSGWVHSRRDLGGLIFIDLRDREGLVQIVSDPDRKTSFAAAETVRSEFVLKVTGVVRVRPPGTANAHLKSGQVEVLCQSEVVLEG